MSNPGQEQNQARLEEQVWGIEPPKRPERTRMGRILAFLESIAGGSSRNRTDGPNYHGPR